MKAEEIRVGNFVWWTDESRTGGWSCPGMVTAFDGKVAKIRTFDDFKEADCSLLNNLRSTTLEEIKDYLCAQIFKCDSEIETLNERIAALNLRIVQYRSTLHDIK